MLRLSLIDISDCTNVDSIIADNTSIETMDPDDSLTLKNLMRRNSKSRKKSTDQNEETSSSSSSSWEKEKEVFELQLTQLQEQLVAAMVQNQQLTEQNKTLQKYDAEQLTKLLDEEKSKRKNTEDRLRRIIAARKRRGSGTSTVSDFDDLVGDVDNVSTSQESNEHSVKKASWSKRMLEYKILAWNCFHERISDFINDEDATIEEEEEEQLTIRKLKENVARFSDAIQPFKKGYQFLSDLFGWKNPWLTITVFLIFMYAFWLEVYIPMAFMLMLLQLAVNYLHARGIAQKFTYKKLNASEKEETKEPESSTSLSERYQLVLSIARTVQNKLGTLADNLEKLQNLLLWQHEEASKKLFYSLLMGFFVSCFLPTSTFLLLLGLSMGIKLFIITPVYTRFPKVERRYDDVKRLWEDLPTHSENLQRKLEELEDEKTSPHNVLSSNSDSTSSLSREDFTDVGHEEPSRSEDDVSWNTIIFCDRFQLPRTESPLHDWLEGRRCTMMDKDSPLSSMKHGRLYLTANYICFERNQFHNKKNISIKLTDVASVKKSKPISFMPGPGMAIEIVVKNISKPYIFAAMMGRDEAYDSVIRAGKLLNLSWAK